jgi:hypothetical protein
LVRGRRAYHRSDVHPVRQSSGATAGAAEAAAALHRGTLPIAWLRATKAYENAFFAAWLDSAKRSATEELPRTRIVNCRREPSDLFIGRPSKWHNPFHIGPDGTREQVVAKYRQWIIRQPRLLREVRALRGKTLGCNCPPLPCHGEVLAELADMGY